MSNPTRIFASLLLLSAAVAGGYLLYGQRGTGEITPAPLDTAPPRGPKTAPVVDPTVETAAGNTATEQPAPSDRKLVESDNTHTDALQGVKGRVLMPDGTPAADVPVFLMENMMNDPIKVFLMSKSGRSSPPVSFGTTGTDGTFALGVRQPDMAYDLRVTSDFHPELTHQSIKVRPEDWFDTGDLALEPGLTITGRVIDEASRAGVGDAVVQLADSNQANTLLPTPGRERGIVAVTDATGAFRFTNAPTQGLVNLTAEAAGYASTSLTNQSLRPDTRPDFTLEIARGSPIAGIVVDTSGAPLPGVRVTAQGLSQKTPQTATTSTDGSGVFQFPSLREGPYQLVASDSAFTDQNSPPIMTGDTEVKLVLVQRPWVKLRVRAANGTPIQAYRISLKRHFPNNELGIGNVPEFADRSITPADYSEFGEWAAVRGLPTGQFVFQITERDHAKSLSPPFTVRLDLGPAEVEATLTLGASITGTVIDDGGKPVRGAVVSTDMNNALSDGGGFLDFLKQMIPERHSKAQTRTDAQGRFRLGRLAFASYMVRVAHPEFCEGKAFDIVLSESGQVADVGAVQLTRGTVIEGFTTIAGQAVGQIKVSISLPPETIANPDLTTPPTNPARVFSANAISDNDGRYRLLKRVPPGTYKILAMRTSGASNPLEVMFDVKETEKTITVAPGQDRLQISFNLSAR